ncbi:hypothetical protein PFICI_10835 [Pestalotiopsis fici W106-1]|uniref:Baeyer-Villiger oxidase ptaJ n=1 Tax=Pestalotiopsis fici (strain W106-1 / CGMCC3.15140) TaxID=1229662 RepID=PTAJ_PESFW|nr:uncharacterized protein PFICI_10835 [Pestalotiopsis fici W106-1]A0A067XMK8.1 RecName: Full=Baeyer-Villiger oxidase ptaJ; AltName: Full=Pestheic acid biosynthesis cluster protein J [Pestalotiopsis fici W106-1]AGO59039.1 PtaJ [Pestalotiopsis fici]ETS76961.1 hypothetical protein PFICI_10835 [Pestalotiopsis fici W106-1]
MAASTAAQVQLSEEALGLARIFENPKGSLEAASKLLQKNHDEFHVFWRDVGGHNHIPHSVLSILALGGGPAELQRAWDDGVAIQRPTPPLDEDVVKKLENPAEFRARIGSIPNYTNFLHFFRNQMDKKGWQAVVSEYAFSRTPLAETIFAQLFEGAYHPFIHIGFGIEFNLPSIIAEGLAQAATHDSAGIEGFFLEAERQAAQSKGPGKSLVQLLDEVRTTEKIKTAARLPDGPVRVRDGVIGRAGAEIAALASQFRVPADQLSRGAAESINISAYTAGAAQRAGKARKIDFFHMHNTTSSLFLTVFLNQPWISTEDKVRIVEWKGRLDLVWYAACSAPDLNVDHVIGYKPAQSAGWGWKELYEAINVAHDDGHLAKIVRALKNGEEVSRPFESGEGAEAFPIKGDSWLKLAQMSYDTTLDLPDDDKWIWGAGFLPLWNKVPSL